MNRLQTYLLFFCACGLGNLVLAGDSPAGKNSATNVYFGDTHLHTAFSADAAIMGNRSLYPDQAYRFAAGLPVEHPQHGGRVQLDRPLDFLSVSDHAEYLGVVPAIIRQDPRVNRTAVAGQLLEKVQQGKLWEAFTIVLNRGRGDEVDPAFISAEITSDTWQQITAAADRHNRPGEFTALVAWEWSAMPREKGQMAGPNLHRVVIMNGSGEQASRFIPFSSSVSQRPEDLWQWLEQTSKKIGTDFVAIPHNSNIGQGKMFDTVDSDGKPISADYARVRMRWEPVVETTQFKGDSETHPFLSPDDEFADYELFILAGQEVSQGDYVRGALKRGLEIQQQTGVNPYQFGQIGASDSHTGMASIEEDNFHGKWASESTPKQLLAGKLNGTVGAQMGAAGLAAVWANDNTREEIFAAFKRREVYATTGTRMTVRFFGGSGFTKDHAQLTDIAKTGYANGVPMGSSMPLEAGNKPAFLLSAAKDPQGANLDRIQVVKGWVDAQGNSYEKIYNVAMSGNRQVDADGNVSPVGDTVNRETASYDNSIGAAQLAAFWQDDDYQPSQLAVFYYARVLEIPTPRFSLIDAVASEQTHPDIIPETVQERAYTSPIWIH